MMSTKLFSPLGRRVRLLVCALTLVGCGQPREPKALDYYAAFPDAGPRYACTGTATPCASRSLSGCETGGSFYGTGFCELEGSCGGTPTQCSTFTSSGTCTAQPGCTWDASFALCSGAPQSCAERTFTACARGCTFSGGACGGTARGCAQLGSECVNQPGCTWAPVP